MLKPVISLPRCLLIATCVITGAHILANVVLWDRALHSFETSVRPVASDFVPPAKSNNRIFLDNDPYLWISYAREMAETGQWRIRYTHMDNVPFGREVHWSQSMSWLLVGAGYLRHLYTGESMYDAIQGGALWVNPVLMLLFVVVMSWVLYRRLGAIAAALFAFVFVTTPDTGWPFHVFRPDHHGLHLAFILGTTVCLILGGLGWVTKRPVGASEFRPAFFIPFALPNEAQARRYFVAAGVLTGLGLWIGATVQFFLIGATAVGAVLLTLFMPKQARNEEIDYVPELWRLWAIWGGIVGIVFYLIEYFPAHFAMRLEVNHPLYVLTILCVGEMVTRLTRWRLGFRSMTAASWLGIAVLAAGVALVPLLITLGPPTWHKMRDPQMQRMVSFISEFSTYLNFQPNEPLAAWFRSNGVLPLFMIGALWLSAAARSQLYEWAALWISFFLSFFFLMLMWWQIRWVCVYAGLSIWLMIVVGQIALRNALAARDRFQIWVLSLIGVIVLGQVAIFAARVYKELDVIYSRKVVAPDLINPELKKRLTEELKVASGGKELRIACEPDFAPCLDYFGGISSLISFYWENVEGLHAATAFFTDHGEAIALQIAKERGLTHILISDDPRLAARISYFATGNLKPEVVESTLMARLQRGDATIPSWIEIDPDLTRIGRRKFLCENEGAKVFVEGHIRIFRINLSKAEP